MRVQIRFFALKCDLFSREKLTKEITLDDLDKDDVHAVKSGFICLLPERDTSGRLVMVGFARFLTTMPSTRAAERAAFYIYNSINRFHDSAAIQKYGINGIMYDHSDAGLFKERHSVWKLAKLRNAVPWRYSAMHRCCATPVWLPLMSLEIAMIQTYEKALVRSHCGAHVERRYGLMTYGVPIDAFPVNGDGEIDLSNHLARLEKLAIQEEMEATACSTAARGSATPNNKTVGITPARFDGKQRVNEKRASGSTCLGRLDCFRHMVV